MAHPGSDFRSAFDVELTGDVDVGMTQRSRRRVNAVLGADARAEFLSERVQRFIALDALGAQPLRQGVEDQLASVTIPANGSDRARGFDDEFSGRLLLVF